MTSRPDFTCAGYAALLDEFVAREYQATTYSDVDPGQRHLVLRHDLDISIQAARPIADIEAARGMAAHYFVLLRTEMYNPWSHTGRADLRAIADAGHEIGLHFDAALYVDDLDVLDRVCREECDVLEQLMGRAVTSVSFHRPRESLLGLDRPLGGRRHTYQPAFFTAIGYCSDSRGAWHHGHPLDHSAVTNTTALQLLTHPIWWTGEGPGVQRRLDGFIDHSINRLRDEVASQIETFRA
jgi:hypothetical protein